MKTRSNAGILFGVLLLSLWLLPPSRSHPLAAQPPTFWFTENIDATDSCSGISVDLAYGQDDILHLTFSQRTGDFQMYARYAEDGWQLDIVDDVISIGNESSLALDGNGYPHIAYRNNTTLSLKYARWDGSKWHTKPISVFENIYAISLAIDSNDKAHIAYNGNVPGTGQQIPKYARQGAGGWEIMAIEDIHTYYKISLAVDSMDTPHITYMNSQSLVIAVLNETLTSGPTWDIETVDTTDGTDHVGIYSALALDGDDKAHVAYAVYGQEPFTPSYPKYLKYATNQSGSWTFDFPAPGEEAGFYNSITLDTDNRPHISYFDRGRQAVKYVYWDGASWHRETVASGVFIQGLPGIQLDENNQPYIAYCDIFSNTVRVARLVTQEHQMYLPQAWD